MYFVAGAAGFVVLGLAVFVGGYKRAHSNPASDSAYEEQQALVADEKPSKKTRGDGIHLVDLSDPTADEASGSDSQLLALKAEVRSLVQENRHQQQELADAVADSGPALAPSPRQPKFDKFKVGFASECACARVGTVRPFVLASHPWGPCLPQANCESLHCAPNISLSSVTPTQTDLILLPSLLLR